MNIEKTGPEKCRITLKVALDAAETKAQDAKIVRKVSAQASLPGFRKGKVPESMVRQYFKEAIFSEKVNSIPLLVIEAAKKEGVLEVIGVAEIKDVDVEGEEFKFTAGIDVDPVFDLPKYKEIELPEPESEATPEDVDQAVERMRDSYAKYVDDNGEGAIAAGDIVQIDYSGEIDGKGILETVPEAGRDAAEQGTWLTAGEFRIKAVDEALIGMKTGETKEGIAQKFPDDWPVEQLRGLVAKYKVTVKALRTKKLPDDAQLVAESKLSSMDELRGKFQEGISARKAEMAKQMRFDAACAALVSQSSFDLPGIRVDQLADRTIEEYKKRALSMGIDAKYLQEKRDDILAEARQTAENQVRLWYIARAICKAENIDANVSDCVPKAVDVVIANAKKKQ